MGKVDIGRHSAIQYDGDEIGKKSPFRRFDFFFSAKLTRTKRANATDDELAVGGLLFIRSVKFWLNDPKFL
jgi:hypothetical protein